jgi:hypothetical protein
LLKSTQTLNLLGSHKGFILFLTAQKIEKHLSLMNIKDQKEINFTMLEKQRFLGKIFQNYKLTLFPNSMVKRLQLELNRRAKVSWKHRPFFKKTPRFSHWYCHIKSGMGAV